MPRKPSSKRRRNRKNKRSAERPQRGRKPDEVLTAGPLTLVRRGRVVEAHMNWDPGEFAKMRASIPAHRESLREQIAQSVEQAVSLIAACDPLPLLPPLFFKNCVVNPETYSEPEHEGKEARVEYAHSLIMAAPAWGTEPPTKDQFTRFETLVEEILDSSLHYFMLREGKDDSPMEVEATKFLGMTRHLFIRGSSMVEHDTDLIRAIYGPHAEMLRRHGLFTTEELIAFCERLTAAVDRGLMKQVGTLQKMKELHARFVEMLDADPELDARVAIETIRGSESALRISEDLDSDAGLLSPLGPHRVARTADDEPILSALSMAKGDNADFLTFEKSPGWPSNNSRIHARPLIERDGAVFCPSPVLLTRNRGTILEAAIRGADSTYFGNQFARKRGRVLEELALEHFERLLPGGSVHHSLYYRIGDQRFETDGIIIFDGYLFILEMKSAPFSVAALRGADKGLKADLEHLVDEPYAQAKRTLAYIRDNEPASFETEDGTVALTIESLSEFRRTYIINVTLADIGHVSARLSSAKAMGFLEGDEWPWSVFINDLRVLSEIIESPADFLLFLNRRLALNDLPAVSTLDELDYLGWFLKHGLFFRKEDFGPHDRLSMIGYTVPIERYYDHVAGRVSSGDKPRLNIREWYRDLVAALGRTGKPGCHHIGSVLLSLDGNEQERIETFFREYSTPNALANGPRSLTLLATELTSFILVVSADNIEKHREKHVRYADMKRLQTDVSAFFVILVEGADMRKVDFEIREGAFPDLEGTRRELEAFARSKYTDYVESVGTPGRNEHCPCNSGRKFKKCCLPRSRSW